MTDRDIFLIEVARRGRDGDYAGASDVAALDTRVDALEARPNITSLDAVPNVAAAAPTSGQYLKWDGTNWVPANVTSGVALLEGSTTVVPNATFVDFEPGSFNITNESDTYGIVRLQFGGGGTASSVARYDHPHTLNAPARVTFGPQAYMSGGTRSLASTSVTLTSGINYVVRARLNMQMRGADAGACYYQLRLTINGNARTSGAGTAGFWCVQGVPDKTTWEHHLAITGTGTAITVSADVLYHSGGGFYTDAGEIVVELDANR